MEKCNRPPERFYRQKQVRKSDSCWLSSRTTFSLRKRFDLYFSYRDARQYYESQITGLRTQLSRTQKQLKRASEDRARQTKRIAELTHNGG